LSSCSAKNWRTGCAGAASTVVGAAFPVYVWPIRAIDEQLRLWEELRTNITESLKVRNRDNLSLFPNWDRLLSPWSVLNNHVFRKFWLIAMKSLGRSSIKFTRLISMRIFAVAQSLLFGSYPYRHNNLWLCFLSACFISFMVCHRHDPHLATLRRFTSMLWKVRRSRKGIGLGFWSVLTRWSKMCDNKTRPISERSQNDQISVNCCKMQR
jgi:hypothetical protein